MAKANDPLAALNQAAATKEESLRKEVETLKQTVSRMSNENEALREAATNASNGTTIKGYIPDEAQARLVWQMAYTEAVRSIFGKGLGFWTSKGKTLYQELELATIRADEAAEAYIRIRKTFMDPVTKELQDFNKAKSTNPLVSTTDL